MIKPTVGRVVWYTPPHAPAGEPANDPQPHAALIAYVWHDRMVNLAVFSPNGDNYGVTSVTLVQEGDMAPEAGRFAEWMPYQAGQAKKHSAEVPKQSDREACKAKFDRIKQKAMRQKMHAAEDEPKVANADATHFFAVVEGATA